MNHSNEQQDVKSVRKSSTFISSSTSTSSPLFLGVVKASEVLSKAIHANDRVLIQKIIKQVNVQYGHSKKGIIIWNKGLTAACQTNNVQLVQEFVQRGADDFNSASHIAFQFGFQDIITWLTKRQHLNINMAMIGACAGGHTNWVLDMINCGANRFDAGMRAACQGGHRDCFEIMVHRGATHWNTALSTSARYGRLDMVQRAIELGADNFRLAMQNASFSKQLHVVEYLLDYGHGCTTEWLNNHCAMQLVVRGNRHMLNDPRGIAFQQQQQQQRRVVERIVKSILPNHFVKHVISTYI